MKTYSTNPGDLDLAERAALRRVAGLSTELTDVSEVEYRRLRLERVVLVGVWTEGTAHQAQASLAELARLAETAGSHVVEGLIQRRPRPDPATFIGSGKTDELRGVVAATGADTVVCDGELSLGQLRQLEDKLKVKVVDRTALILDIFAQHARSKEGKAQVELAQLNYLLPRLRGWGHALSRTGAGIGTRGPGETKLETDRRRINQRIAKLRREIVALRTIQHTKRARRAVNAVPSVAIAGYTNAGKSSVLNALTGAGVLVQDALFATLDPTTRRATTADGRVFTLTDTVGFVRHLPHDLVEAFASTLEEVANADLVLHVVDATCSLPEDQISVVRQVINDIVTKHATPAPPELLVINKADVADGDTLVRLRQLFPDAVCVSAQTGMGFPDLLDRLAQSLPTPEIEIDVVLPYSQGALLSRVHSEGQVLTQQHTETGTQLRARVRANLAKEIRFCALA